jgi:hypothetical protein
LKSTLVLGPASNGFENLAALYRRLRVDSRANFVRLELPSDMIVPRHAAPLTRSSLYPLGLAKVDLRAWIDGASLTGDEVRTVWRLAAFLHAQSRAGHNKLTLVLPKIWTGAARWTTRALEECLSATDGPALSVYSDEPVRLANYHRPKEACQDRLFLAVQLKGEAGPESGKVALLRRTGYPVAVLTLERATPLSKFMQSVHYLAFGTAWLSDTSFVSRPAAVRPAASQDPSPHRAEWRGSLSLQFCHLPKELRPKIAGLDAPSCYAIVLRSLAERRRIDSGEFAVTAEIRYSKVWRAIERCLERAAERVIRSPLKMPARVGGEFESARRGAFVTLVAGGQPAPSGLTSAHLVVSSRDAGERVVQALDTFFGRTAAALKKR